MLHKDMAMKWKEQGFTLVEVMIVLVIIGIIAAIAVPSLMGFTDRAKEQACEANIKALETAVAAYSAAHDGDLPDELDDLREYFDELPDCPFSGDYTIGDGGIITCSHKSPGD